MCLLISEPVKYENMKTCSLKVIGIRTEKKQRINAAHCSRFTYLCLFIFDYESLFNNFGSIFGALFFIY